MVITTEAQLLHLLAVSSSAFPVGSFAYSHGLEWAIECGHVSSVDALCDWIEGVISSGSGWNDAVAYSLAYSADTETCQELDALVLAMAVSRERHLETSDIGQSYCKAIATFENWRLLPYRSYPIVAAMSCENVGIPKLAGLLAFLQNFSNALIGVAVRLVPLGQTKGLEAMRVLRPSIIRIARRAMEATLDDLGSSAVMADISSMKHETQHSRIFRS